MRTLIFDEDVAEPIALGLFGATRDNGARKHLGVDIPVRGKKAKSLIDGYVHALIDTQIGGKEVWIKNNSTDELFIITHCDSFLVSQGKQVKKGDYICVTGNSGNAEGFVAHIQYSKKANYALTHQREIESWVDPLPYILKFSDMLIIKGHLKVNGTPELFGDDHLKHGQHAPANAEASFDAVRESLVTSPKGNYEFRISGTTNSWVHVNDTLKVEFGTTSRAEITKLTEQLSQINEKLTQVELELAKQIELNKQLQSKLNLQKPSQPEQTKTLVQAIIDQLFPPQR